MEAHHGNIRPLATKEMTDLLGRTVIGHLGCHKRSEMYLVPVVFAFQGDHIYCHSRVGKKIEMMRANPRVCFQVEEVDNLFRWRSVFIRGRFEELEGIDAANAMRTLSDTVAGKEKGRNISTMDVEVSAIFSKAIFYRIRIEEMTGRAEGC